MRPCAQPGCPALATRCDYCPVHFRIVLDGDAEIVSPEETAAAIEQRKRIARIYHHEDR